MAMMKPLAGRKHVKTPADGNTGVRFKDATAAASAVLFGGMTNKSGQKPTNSSGCSGCNR